MIVVEEAEEGEEKARVFIDVLNKITCINDIL